MANWAGIISITLLLLQGLAQCAILEASSHESGFDGAKLVVAVEVVKLLLSIPCCMVFDMQIFSPQTSFYSAVPIIWENVAHMSVPGFLFVIQNNLVFLAAARLPSSVIQVLQQVKLFWTAAFSIVILKRSVFFWQWMALVVLMAGATIVQLDIASRSEPRSVQEGNLSTNDGFNTDPEPCATWSTSSVLSWCSSWSGPLLGMAASIASSALSGFNGVFLESSLKQHAAVGATLQPNRDNSTRTPGCGEPTDSSSTTSNTSTISPDRGSRKPGPSAGVWTRNVQLSFYGILFGLASLVWREASDSQLRSNLNADSGMQEIDEARKMLLPQSLVATSIIGLNANSSASPWSAVRSITLLPEFVGRAVEGLGEHIQTMDVSTTTLVLVLAIGGILVSLVTGYTSSMAKNVATTGSTVLGVVAVQIQRNELPTGAFVAGVLLVLGGALWYRLGVGGGEQADPTGAIGSTGEGDAGGTSSSGGARGPGDEGDTDDADDGDEGVDQKRCEDESIQASLRGISTVQAQLHSSSMRRRVEGGVRISTVQAQLHSSSMRRRVEGGVRISTVQAQLHSSSVGRKVEGGVRRVRGGGADVRKNRDTSGCGSSSSHAGGTVDVVSVKRSDLGSAGSIAKMVKLQDVYVPQMEEGESKQEFGEAEASSSGPSLTLDSRSAGHCLQQGTLVRRCAPPHGRKAQILVA